jgi:hypothetical protein
VEPVDSPGNDPSDQDVAGGATPPVTSDRQDEQDGRAEQDGSEAGKDPLRFNNWMKRSATGAVMTGIALGFQAALQPRKPEAPFVIEGHGDPDDLDGPIDLRFDPDSPSNTVAIIRRPVPDDGPPPPST